MMVISENISVFIFDQEPSWIIDRPWTVRPSGVDAGRHSYLVMVHSQGGARVVVRAICDDTNRTSITGI